PYIVPIQMAPFPKHIFLNLADIAELPNRTLVDIMAIVVHLDTIHRTMWGPFRNIVIMDASLSDGYFTNFATQGIADIPITIFFTHHGDENVNVNQDDGIDWLHRNETFKADDVFTTRDLLTPGGVHETVGNTPNHNLERVAYFRERYKNLTPAEREFRRERLRLYNNTPKRKGSKIEYIRKRRALLADTLSQESIAMEYPTYTLELPLRWVIPEIASNPFLLASTQTEDVDPLHMSTGPLRRKQHVPRGGRQAILARRNRQFEASISRNMATATEDTISDAGEGDDWTQPHMNAKINNNVQCRNQCHGAIVATNESASMTEQGSGVDHTQSKPRVISN
ncbi:hypothetical protein ACJX0J_031181, partial [Zea mays]